MYGLGNWEAVAEHVGTKSRDDCCKHYFAIYIQSPSFPRPTPAPEMAGLDAHAWVKDRQRSRRLDSGVLGSPLGRGSAARPAVAAAREVAAEQSGVAGPRRDEAADGETQLASVKVEVRASPRCLLGQQSLDSSHLYSCDDVGSKSCHRACQQAAVPAAHRLPARKSWVGQRSAWLFSKNVPCSGCSGCRSRRRASLKMVRGMQSGTTRGKGAHQ